MCVSIPQLFVLFWYSTWTIETELIEWLMTELFDEVDKQTMKL